jgi:hypothetical protein
VEVQAPAALYPTGPKADLVVVERRKTSIPDRNQKHRSVPDIVFTV